VGEVMNNFLSFKILTLERAQASVSHLKNVLFAKESQIQSITKGQAALKDRAQELQRGQERGH
ncbi:hypothetical protein BGZ81_005354, partial [Podila clonocystis]